jgi:hypothetical protein
MEGRLALGAPRCTLLERHSSCMHTQSDAVQERENRQCAVPVVASIQAAEDATAGSSDSGDAAVEDGPGCDGVALLRTTANLLVRNQLASD